jgi:hypothetical protein
MNKKFNEAFDLLFKHFGLISALVLTVWLPGNLLLGYATLHAEDEWSDLRTTLRLSQFIEAIFSPLYIGALVYALSRFKQGWTVTYGEALREGWKNWGTLFGARLLAGVFILLGLIALIVPGIILALRYAFLDYAVVLEGTSSSEARSRSTELTKSVRGQIFGATLIFLIGYLLFSGMLYLPLELIGIGDNFVANVLLDCLSSIFYVVLTIILFLYYWEAAEKERAARLPEDEAGTPTPTFKMFA